MTLSPVVELTPAAKTFLSKQLDETQAAVGMRMSVKTAGCSGYKYVLTPVSQLSTDDLAYHLSERYQLFIDPKAVPFIQGTTIDYVKQGLNRQLVYRNPNEVNSCGCGESFYVEK